MEEIIARGSYGFDCSGGCARCSYELDIDKGVYRCVSEDSVYECPPAPNGGVDYLGRFEVAAAENSVTLGELRVLLPQELGLSTGPATTLDATQTYTLSIPSGVAPQPLARGGPTVGCRRERGPQRPSLVASSPGSRRWSCT